LLHDSNHRAVFTPLNPSSRHMKRADRLFAWVVSDVMIGVNSCFWKRKHDWHHSDTNIAELDVDIRGEPLMRFHPAGKNVWIAQYQQYYAWGLYTLLIPSLHMTGLRFALGGGNYGPNEFKRTKGWELVGTITGALVFYAWAIVLPVWRFGWPGLFGYLAVVGTAGLVYGCVFQFAHCVEEVDYPVIKDLEGAIGIYDFQLATTANFCPNNWCLRWLINHLTHQAEHHLERGYPNTFYRFIEPEVTEWCQRYGLEKHVNGSLWSALKSHWLHLRDMGRRGEFAEIDMG
jgi:linoleoyl-CoA desaturase